MGIVVYLLIIIITKVLLTKAVSLMLILLSFILKGKALRKEETEWNNYFINLSESFVIKYAICIYILATILSFPVTYALFLIFKFRNPLVLTIILLTVCMIISGYRYRKKGKKEIVQGLYRVQQSVSSHF